MEKNIYLGSLVKSSLPVGGFLFISHSCVLASCYPVKELTVGLRVC